ncbi:hypothetical protein MSG28_015735 [Choristoneura fumiferana]|uniref:Uncharacterized protein n=1 Tax=Choristoneura fumiferana TaxID=7141 RepID=A0ACC0KBX8_CHOFU|nr:hypothetical protein MSG28_015735 [Choristoneura fumiferana]
MRHKRERLVGSLRFYPQQCLRAYSAGTISCKEILKQIGPKLESQDEMGINTLQTFLGEQNRRFLVSSALEMASWKIEEPKRVKVSCKKPFETRKKDLKEVKEGEQAGFLQPVKRKILFFPVPIRILEMLSQCSPTLPKEPTCQVSAFYDQYGVSLAMLRQF